MKKTRTPVSKTLSHVHAALLEDLQKLEEAVSPRTRKSPTELSAGLRAARAHIARHFRFEEQNGYMDAVRKRQPRLERAIQQLADEHGQLKQSLDALLGEAKSAISLDDAFRERIRQWIERVRQHEMRENDLVQDAFDLDIGVKD